MSGTTFNTVLLAANIFSFLINLYDSLFSNIAVVNHFWILLWIHALIWTTYLQFVVYAYRGTKELCFYCTWVLAFELLHVIVLNYLCGKFCYVLYLICGAITVLVLFSSQAARMDRKYKQKQEKKDREERARQIEERRVMLEEREKAEEAQRIMLEKRAKERQEAARRKKEEEEANIEVIECPGHEQTFR